MSPNPDMLELVPLEEQVSQKKIFVGIALDRSGSMMDIRKETISGVNEQIDDIKTSAKTADVSVSLVTFSARGQWQYFNEPIEQLEKLTNENYIPDGSTAMYEGVGMLVDRLRDETKELPKNSYSVLIIVISDGMNNVNSPEYNSTKVAEKIKTLQGDGNWTFTYVGANQDLSKIQESLGIKAGNIMAFTADSQGTQRGWSGQDSQHRNALRSYMVSASLASNQRDSILATANFYDITGNVPDFPLAHLVPDVAEVHDVNDKAMDERLRILKEEMEKNRSEILNNTLV
jgi:uncharacterized protein YegL